MEETRVSRYKEYRQSFIKEGSIVSDASDDEEVIDLNATTSTLPIEEVIDAVQHEEQSVKMSNRSRRNHIIKIVVEVSVAVLVVAGLIVLGILGWRN